MLQPGDLQLFGPAEVVGDRTWLMVDLAGLDDTGLPAEKLIGHLKFRRRRSMWGRMARVTRLVCANVKVLQTLMGHKTATLTLDRYGHLFPDDLGRIADAFDAAAENTADWLRTGPGLRAVPSDGDGL